MKDIMVSVYDIAFYKYDENGLEVLNEDGTIKQFRLKDGIRFKPLEYLCEDMTEEMLIEYKGRCKYDRTI